MRTLIAMAAIAWFFCSNAGVSSASETIRNVPPAPHGAPETSSLDDIARAIVQAAGERQWYGGIERDGVIVVSTIVRTHRAVVEIGFDERNFWIDYRDSSKLDYNPNDLTRFERGSGSPKRVIQKGPRIHANYNLWVAELAHNVAARTQHILTSVRTREGGTGPVLIADELEKLDQLRQRGVLTQHEFDAQKAKLLAR